MDPGVIDPLGMTCEEFVAACRERGVARPGALEAYCRVFREGATEAWLRPRASERAGAAAHGAPEGGSAPAARGSTPVVVARAGVAPIGRVLREACDEGEVVKFTQVLGEGTERRSDGAAEGKGTRGGPGAPAALETESVLIPMVGRKGIRTYTLCVSSQVGCAMGCAFCETAQMGLVRSLTPAEIVGQWHAARWGLGVPPRNLVFMGMGEPMDNLDAVIRAIAVLTDRYGPNVPMNKITVSTVGRVDGIRRLAEQVRRPGWHRLNLAVSVNAPDDGVRSRIMPVNRAMPMAALRRALEDWPRYGGGKICVEYVLIPGVNDGPGHARALAGWVRGLPACVNVIPYNPRRGSPWPAPAEAAVAAFLRELVAAGAYAKRRRTKGRDMMGACGQLGSERIRRRRYVEVGVPA